MCVVNHNSTWISVFIGVDELEFLSERVIKVIMVFKCESGIDNKIKLKTTKKKNWMM